MLGRAEKLAARVYQEAFGIPLSKKWGLRPLTGALIMMESEEAGAGPWGWPVRGRAGYAGGRERSGRLERAGRALRAAGMGDLQPVPAEQSRHRGRGTERMAPAGRARREGH